MEIKYRRASRNEKYACSLQNIKKAFHDEPVFISFGYLGRTFRFDSAFSKRPVIKGLILCSASCNRRLDLPTDTEPYLCFYIIRDDRYTEEQEQAFLTTVLPRILDWFKEVHAKPETAIPGVEQLLVEWTGQGFQMHPCRFQ